MAAVRVNGLNAEPACRREGATARFTLLVSWLGSGPPTIARISPVRGSIATSAALGSVFDGRWSATDCSAAFCICLSRLVYTRRPPVYVICSPIFGFRSSHLRV